MADQTVTSLIETNQLQGDEELYVVDDPSGTPVDRKVKTKRILPPPYITDRSYPNDDIPFAAYEFDNTTAPYPTVTTYDAGWSTLVPTGTLTTAVGKSCLSMSFNAQASGDMAGVVRSLPGGLPAIYSIECAYRAWNERQDLMMAGPFIANGGLTTSSVMWWMPYWGTSSFIDSFRAGTPEAIVTDYGSIERYPYGGQGVDVLLMRMIVDTTDSTVRIEKSIDGVLWSLHGSTNFDRALNFTPTHFGFGVSTWGGTTTSWTRLASVDYMRIYDLT